MVRTVFSHKDAFAVSHEFVSLVAHGNTDHPQGEYLMGGRKMHLCGIYDLPDCKAHEDMRAVLGRKDLLKGVAGTPAHIFYNPHDLTELSRANYMSLKDFEDHAAAAQKVLGKPITWREWTKLRKPLEAARELLAKEDYRKALRELEDFDPQGRESLTAEGEALRGEILAAGRARLDEAKALLEQGENGKALKILRDVSRDFPDTEVGEEAKKLIPQAK